MGGLVRYLAVFQGGSPYVRVERLLIKPLSEGLNSLDAMLELHTFSFAPSGQPPAQEAAESFDLARAEKTASFSRPKPIDLSDRTIRDPFLSSALGGSAGVAKELKLSGIVLKSDRSCCLAIINRRLVKEGDIIANCKVAQIATDHVVLEQQDRKLILRMGGTKQ